MTNDEIVRAIVNALEANRDGRTLIKERGEDVEFFRGRSDALLEVLAWFDKEEADRQRKMR